MNASNGTATLVQDLRRQLGEAQGKKKISRAELAKKLGKSPASIFNWERNRSVPSKSSRKAIERLLAEARKSVPRAKPKTKPARSSVAAPPAKLEATHVAVMATAIGNCPSLAVARAAFESVMELVGENRSS